MIYEARGMWGTKERKKKEEKKKKKKKSPEEVKKIAMFGMSGLKGEPKKIIR
jgi:hypothetical protein